jgi:hypothetical protein
VDIPLVHISIGPQLSFQYQAVNVATTALGFSEDAALYRVACRLWPRVPSWLVPT